MVSVGREKESRGRDPGMEPPTGQDAANAHRNMSKHGDKFFNSNIYI